MLNWIPRPSEGYEQKKNTDSAPGIECTAGGAGPAFLANRVRGSEMICVPYCRVGTGVVWGKENGDVGCNPHHRGSQPSCGSGPTLPLWNR